MLIWALWVATSAWANYLQPGEAIEISGSCIQVHAYINQPIELHTQNMLVEQVFAAETYLKVTGVISQDSTKVKVECHLPLAAPRGHGFQFSTLSPK